MKSRQLGKVTYPLFKTSRSLSNSVLCNKQMLAQAWPIKQETLTLLRLKCPRNVERRVWRNKPVRPRKGPCTPGFVVNQQLEHVSDGLFARNQSWRYPVYREFDSKSSLTGTSAASSGKYVPSSEVLSEAAYAFV